MSLSKVQKDHPEIELKYLPSYQQKQVKATIAEGGLPAAQSKVSELAVQASACKKENERQKAEAENQAKAGGDATGTTQTSLTSKASPTPNPSGSTSKTPTAPTPHPAPPSRRKSRRSSHCAESSKQAVRGPVTP